MAITKALAALGLAAICAAGSLTLIDAGEVQAKKKRLAGAQPNVVVLYVDDVNPNTRWLWNDRRRTPMLAKFHHNGVEFRNAIASTPLCGPSRAALLTGQFGHNSRVTGNGMQDFDPTSTLATKLQGSGYHTILGGKYLNRIASVAPTASDVTRYATGWNDFDIIWNRKDRGKGQFYDYDLWTRDGIRKQGSKPRHHSTRVVGQRVARHIREAPAGVPVFAMASLNSGHVPNTAMAAHVGAVSCRDVPKYRKPSFNEARVGDKPAYIRKLDRLKRSGFGLRSRCEEMLSVEYALGKIRTALKETGRLNDTVLLFTADNGYMLNDHRYPGAGGKHWPHAVNVPLYVLWPNGLGNARRVVKEPVSNVDVPVTICKLAGCTLDDPDGIGFLGLLQDVDKVSNRDVHYIEMLRTWRGMPPWYGLVTTKKYDTEARYQYVEYKSGARELYDLTKDPYRLDNLAGKPSQQQRVSDLRGVLHGRFIGPDGVVFP